MNASSLNRFLPDLPSQPDTVLWIALAAIATGMAGELLFRVMRLPRVTGYFLVGLLLLFPLGAVEFNATGAIA